MKVTIQVKAKVLKSHIDNRGIPLEVVAKRSRISQTQLKSYMSQDAEIDQVVLERLAKVFHKPWTMFLLDAAEQKVDIKQDNRTLQNASHGLGAELVKYLQDTEFTLEASKEIDPDYVVKLPMQNLDLKADPDKAGREFRQLMKVDDELCKQIADTRVMLKYWKDLFQAAGIYVSERSLPLNQVRAFSLLEEKKAAIVLSTKDSYEARSFSLIHEVCHILLKQTGICDLNDFAAKKVELFCNKFAASFLAPDYYVKTLIKQYKDVEDKKELVYLIAKNLKISKAATSIRLAELGYIDPVRTLDLEAYKSEKPKNKSKSNNNGGNYYATTINAAGVEFSKQVFNAVSDGVISTRDAAKFLGVGEKNIGTYRSKLYEFNPAHEPAS